VINPNTEDQNIVRASGRFELKAGDRFLIQTAGGGGYGNPRERAPETVQRDIAEGRVTPQAAEIHAPTRS
jgi:N-methylhydantoinase B